MDTYVDLEITRWNFVSSLTACFEGCEQSAHPSLFEEEPSSNVEDDIKLEGSDVTYVYDYHMHTCHVRVPVLHHSTYMCTSVL